MKEGQLSSLERLLNNQKELADNWIEYWLAYSSIGTWQFWVNVAFIIIPLIVLYFTIDRRRAFHLGFYGYSAHVLSTYIDGFATRHGFWEYPFKAIPILPISFGLDTSLIPVVYMLVYQWTLNHKKNYYIYALLVSILFAFVFKPILSALNLFTLENGANYFHLLLLYLSGALLSKWATNLFRYFEQSTKRG
jgi:hypothetical protein